MAQSLENVSPEDFEAKLSQISTGTLKQLIRDIAERTQGNLSTERLTDYLRKETKIWKELQRRGYMPTKDLNDFFKWRWKIFKRRFF